MSSQLSNASHSYQSLLQHGQEAALEERGRPKGAHRCPASGRGLPQYSELGEKREALPAFKQRQQVVAAVKDSQVVLLSGETGCGKSTQAMAMACAVPTLLAQVPQLILDAAPEAGRPF